MNEKFQYRTRPPITSEEIVIFMIMAVILQIPASFNSQAFLNNEKCLNQNLKELIMRVWEFRNYETSLYRSGT